MNEMPESVIVIARKVKPLRHPKSNRDFFVCECPPSIKMTANSVPKYRCGKVVEFAGAIPSLDEK